MVKLHFKWGCCPRWVHWGVCLKNQKLVDSWKQKKLKSKRNNKFKQSKISKLLTLKKNKENKTLRICRRLCRTTKLCKTNTKTFKSKPKSLTWKRLYLLILSSTTKIVSNWLKCAKSWRPTRKSIYNCAPHTTKYGRNNKRKHNKPKTNAISKWKRRPHKISQRLIRRTTNLHKAHCQAFNPQ